MSSKDNNMEEDLQELIERLKDPTKGIKLKTNKHRMKAHKSSFTAVKLIDWLIDTKTVTTRQSGEEIGNKLCDAGLIVLLTGPTGTLFKDSNSIWKFAGINTPPDTPSRGSGYQIPFESPRRTLSVSNAHDITSMGIRSPQRSLSTAVVETHNKASPPQSPPPAGLPPPLPNSSSKPTQSRTASAIFSPMSQSHSHGHSSSPPSTLWNYKAGSHLESTDMQNETSNLRTASNRRIFPSARSGMKSSTDSMDDSKNSQSPKQSQDSFLQMFVASHSDLASEIGNEPRGEMELQPTPPTIDIHHRPRAHSQLHSASPYKSNDSTKGRERENECAPPPTIPENLTRRKTLQFVSHNEIFVIRFVNEGIKKTTGLNTEIKIRPLSEIVQKVCVQRGLNMNEYTAKDSAGNVVSWNTLVGDLYSKEIYLEEKHPDHPKRNKSRNRISSEWSFSSSDRPLSSPVVPPPPTYHPPPLTDRLTDSMISDSSGDNSISTLVVRFSHDESKKTLLLTSEQKLQTLRESVKKICTLRNLKIENYTAKDINGTEIDMDRLMGEINIHEVVMEPSELEGPPPPTYIPLPPTTETTDSPPINKQDLFTISHIDKSSSCSNSSSEETESYTVPKLQEREVPQIACANVTQTDPWHLQSPTTSPQRVVLLKGGTIAHWSREASWAVLCGNRSLNVAKENPTFFQLEKIGGRDHTLRVGVCGSQLSQSGSNKYSCGLKYISSLYLHGKWFAYRIRPPCRTGDKLGFIIDHKNLIVYKNYNIIEILELDPTLFENPLFPFVALCGDIQVAITPFPDLEKYEKVGFTHGPKRQVELLVASGLSEMLDDLRVVKFKPYLEKYTLESLTLDVLDEIGLPERLKNLIWQSRNQALGLWCDSKEDDQSRRRSCSEEPSKHRLKISSFSSSTPW